MAKEIIRGIEVHVNTISDSPRAKKEEKEALLISSTLPLLEDIGGGKIAPSRITRAEYDITLSDDYGSRRSFSVDLLQNSVEVLRETNDFINKAVELARKYEGVGLGKFFVIRPYKSI